MAHLVHNGNFTSDSARAAVTKRWQNYRNRYSVEATRKEVDEYFAEKGLAPHEGNPNVFLAATMANAALPIDMRIAAAAKLQPYYNGPPPKEPLPDEPEGEVIDADREAKRKETYDFIMQLIQQSASQPTPEPQSPPNAQPSVHDELVAEPVQPGDEYQPGQAPLSREIIDTDASEPEVDT